VIGSLMSDRREGTRSLRYTFLGAPNAGTKQGFFPFVRSLSNEFFVSPTASL